MTSNQIAYWQLQEQSRSNQARERETARSNRASESEAHRSNLAREQEQNRSNLINEAQNLRAIQETERSNRVKESETNRANLARESETHRSNVAVESETERSNRARESYNLGSLAETIRSNVARETETRRSNLVNEAERERSNRANETINTERNTINREHYERLDSETNRHNLVTEGIQQEQNALRAQEIILGYDSNSARREVASISSAASRYSADVNAALGYSNLQEATRSHLANESLTQQANTNRFVADLANVNAKDRQTDVNKSQLNLQREQWEQGGKQNVALKNAYQIQQYLQSAMLFPDQQLNLQSSTLRNNAAAAKDVSSVIGNIMNPLTRRKP